MHSPAVLASVLKDTRARSPEPIWRSAVTSQPTVRLSDPRACSALAQKLGVDHAQHGAVGLFVFFGEDRNRIN
jgi:hypothetical protein